VIKSRVWFGRLAVVALMGSACQLMPGTSPSAHAADVSASPGGTSTPVVLQMAVVDFDSLLKQHPDYDQLKQLDESVGLLEQKVSLIPLQNQKATQAKFRLRMKDELKKAHEEMDAAQLKVKSDIESLGHTYQGQLKTELDTLRSQAGEELKASVDTYKHSHGPTGAPAQAYRPSTPDVGSSSAAYRNNLRLAMARAVAAHRLEMERSTRTSLETDRARLDRELASYEDAVGEKYQSEKLNLQLKMQITKEEPEQKKIETRLGKIGDEIAAAKAKKRAETDAEFNRERAQKQAAYDADEKSYSDKIRIEVIRKLGGDPSAMGRPVATRVESVQSHTPPPEIAAKIKQLEASIRSKMQARSNEVKLRMKGEEDQARAKLEAKRKEIEDHLRQTQVTMEKEFVIDDKNLDKASLAKLDQARKALEKAKSERKELLARMMNDVKQVVAKVAEKHKVPMVLGDVYFNQGLTDLTDLSVVGVKELKVH
jgi:hypothetical protein